MHLEAVERGRAEWNRSKPRLDQRLQPQVNGKHVADDLVGRFLEREKEDALPAASGCVGEVGRDDRLAGA